MRGDDVSHFRPFWGPKTSYKWGYELWGPYKRPYNERVAGVEKPTCGGCNSTWLVGAVGAYFVGVIEAKRLPVTNGTNHMYRFAFQVFSSVCFHVHLDCVKAPTPVVGCGLVLIMIPTFSH